MDDMSKRDGLTGRPESEDAPAADDQPGVGDVTEPFGAAVASQTKAGRRNPCPNCGSRSVAAISYGYPAPSVFDDPGLAAGEFALGGCVIWPDMPEFRCNACGYEWRREAPEEISRPPTAIDGSV